MARGKLKKPGRVLGAAIDQVANKAEEKRKRDEEARVNQATAEKKAADEKKKETIKKPEIKAKIFRDVETGRPSGVRLPNGKTFLGIGKNDIKAIIKSYEEGQFKKEIEDTRKPVFEERVPEEAPVVKPTGFESIREEIGPEEEVEGEVGGRGLTEEERVSGANLEGRTAFQRDIATLTGEERDPNAVMGFQEQTYTDERGVTQTIKIPVTNEEFDRGQKAQIEENLFLASLGVSAGAGAGAKATAEAGGRETMAHITRRRYFEDGVNKIYTLSNKVGKHQQADKAFMKSFNKLGSERGAIASRYQVNSKTNSLTKNILTTAGLTVAAAIVLRDVIGTYPFAGFLAEEGAQSAGIGIKQAMDEGNYQRAEILLDAQDEMFNEKSFLEITGKVPYLNVIQNLNKFFDIVKKTNGGWREIIAKKRGEFETEGMSVGEEIAERDERLGRG